MSSKPNILFLMTDQMQGRVLDNLNPCKTPNIDKLAARGMRFTRAYTPNAVCSPARASLMTGLLPHNHGVLWVTHSVDDDQGMLRDDKAHWAQRLTGSGYKTGYFGKWHIERSGELDRFGWQVFAEPLGSQSTQSPKGFPELSTKLSKFEQKSKDLVNSSNFSVGMNLDQNEGYSNSRFYGVTDVPPEERSLGIRTQFAMDFLDDVIDGDDPWCCFVSLIEPHDPFICGEEAFSKYDVDSLELQPNVFDELENRPGIYKKAAQIFDKMNDRQKREAMACYYANISEIDEQFGRLIKRLEDSGQLEKTIIILTSDHGELLGSHGLYTKNFMASEEIYNIPMVLAGPGIAQGVVTDARVGSHDLCPTILDLVGCDQIEAPDSTSFLSVLADPINEGPKFQKGYAEYFGGRMILTQRVVWNGQWKFVFNGFDFDELYDLENDPYELNNIAYDSQHRKKLKEMTAQMWQVIRDTNDGSLANSNYPSMRVASYGPITSD